MGLYEDLFDFDNDGKVGFDDDYTLMQMTSQNKQGGSSSGGGGNQGCYIATCVYGSYDCPEVWTLRRFRDFYLARSWFGRAFIHVYYATSPTVVSIFGNLSCFRHFWRRILDTAVAKLQANGVSDKPYRDIDWRTDA